MPHCEDCDQERCGSCPGWRRPEATPEAADALAVYHSLARQFVYDFPGALPVVLEVLDLHLTREEWQTLLRRVFLIHDLMTEHQRKDSDGR